MRRFAALAAAGIAVIALSCPAAQAAGTESVHGSWQTLVPAALTSFSPSPGNPTTGAFTAVGSTEWFGSWTGVTTYTMSGTIDLLTNESTGVLQETFIGTAGSTSATGTLELTEQYTLDASGWLGIRCRIVSGSGAFAGAHGKVTFAGQMLSIVSGSGTYTGTWTHA